MRRDAAGLARVIALIAAVALVLSGCGHDSNRPSSAASASSSNATTSTVVSADEAQLNALLLAPGELGVTYTSADLGAPMDTPQPCGQPDPRSVVRPQTRVVGLLADYLDGLGVAENLSKFASADDAQHVMALLRDGVSCGQGTISNASGSTVVALSGVQDVAAQVDALEAFAVVVDLGNSSQVTTIAARVDRLVVVFQIGAKGTSGALDPLQIAKQGVDKIAHG